jgi:O-antigen ligase
MMSNFDLKILKYTSYLFYLIPIFLINSILIADLSVVLIDIIFLYLIIKNKKYNYFNNNYFKIFLLFYMLITIRSLFSENIFLSLNTSIFYVRFGLFALATFFFLENNDSLAKNLRNLFLIILLILFIDTIYQFIFGKNILGMHYRYTSDNNFRLTSFFGKKGVLGSYVCRFFPLIIALFFLDQKNKITNNNIFLILLVSVISFILVILSGERTSIFLLSLGFLLIFLTSKDELKKIFSYSLIVVAIISVLLVSFDQRIKHRVVDSSYNQLGLNSNEKKIHIFGPVYEGHFKVAYKMFSENPIFGKGVKMFRDFCDRPENYVNETACTTHPHNVFVQILSETGVIGFIFIFGLFIIVIKILVTNFYRSFILTKKKINYVSSNFSNAKMCLLIAIFISISPFSPSGNFFNNWLSIIYFYPIGFLIYLDKYKK